MNYSYIFGLLAGITALIAYGLYFKQIFKGQSMPNPSTWGIWFLIGIINTITYFSVTNDNLWQSFIVIAVTLSVLVILVYARIKGRFAKISNIEITIFVLALVIGFFWQITSNDRVANLLLQGTYVISYIPTIFGIIKGTGKEHYVAWSTVIVAYLFSTISLLFDPGVDWVAYVHPIVNGLIGNGIIVTLILFKKLKKI